MTFDQLYDKYYSALCYYATSIIKDDAKAEDIVMEVMLNVMSKGLSTDKPYLYFAVKSRCLNYIRVQVRNKEAETIFCELDCEQIEIKTEVLRMVFERIENLPTKCKNYFKMYFFEGKRVPEISRITGANGSTVRNNIEYAKQVLRLPEKRKDERDIECYVKEHWQSQDIEHMAKVLECTQNAVKYWCKKYGFKPPKYKRAG